MTIDGAMFLGFVIGVVSAYLAVVIAIAIVSVGAPEPARESKNDGKSIS